MIRMAWMSPLAKWNLNDIYHLAVETLIFIITFNWHYCQNVQYKSKKNNSQALKKLSLYWGILQPGQLQIKARYWFYYLWIGTNFLKKTKEVYNHAFPMFLFLTK